MHFRCIIDMSHPAAAFCKKDYSEYSKGIFCWGYITDISVTELYVEFILLEYLGFLLCNAVFRYLGTFIFDTYVQYVYISWYICLAYI